ncbi:MAG: aminoacyl-tRNA hydrolase [Bdellovibrionales bacterium]|nr:aminoacyl-tRNA hydrolase [Bdellovibrionales bacterium]
MKMIVGLGNPGPKYLMTRHNVGFMVIDSLAHRWNCPSDFREDKKALVTKIKTSNEDVLLVKPQTFMNLSGESVQPLMNFYKIELKDLLVVHDEVDLPFGQLRFVINRGHGGQNGVRNIHDRLGSKAYGRLRLGVGSPPHPDFSVADYVLQAYSKSEQSHLPDVLSLACEAIEFFVDNGLEKTANEYNSAKGTINL